MQDVFYVIINLMPDLFLKQLNFKFQKHLIISLRVNEYCWFNVQKKLERFETTTFSTDVQNGGLYQGILKY